MGEALIKLELSEVEKLTSVVRAYTAGPDSVRPEGEYFVAIEPNSFGLPSEDTCPGKTDYCVADCYAIEAERRTATYLKLQRNLDVMQENESVEAMTAIVGELVSDYIAKADKLHIDPEARRFRIHWSGDFFSTDYAQAWRTVIGQHPGIKFFAYTRSFQPDVNVLPILSGVSNLDLFLSVDEQNVDYAREALAGAPDARVAYLVDYYEDVAVLIAKLGRNEGYRDMACPENMRNEKGRRRLPVISKRGGACARCTYCIDKPNTWDVVFVKEGYQFRAQSELPFAETTYVEISRRQKITAKTAQPMGAVAVAETQFSLF
jgi:hypothetical protein